jgi:predicted nucleotidyltransferase
MRGLVDLALELSVDERTLRRAANQGTLRAERISPRRLRLAPGEAAYLRRHWPLLGALRSALRTEPNVELAALFGSVARGDDGPESDLDILVALRDGSLERTVGLEERLERAAGRKVHLLDLETARRNKELLAAAVEEGRVLVDRAEAWASLRSERDRLRRAARRGLERDRRTTLDAVDAFLA